VCSPGWPHRSHDPLYNPGPRLGDGPQRAAEPAVRGPAGRRRCHVGGLYMVRLVADAGEEDGADEREAESTMVEVLAVVFVVGEWEGMRDVGEEEDI
jgi:hypothetical protein